jgi:hypothetical protein
MIARYGGALLFLVAFLCMPSVSAASAESGTEFVGTVLMVDETAGKFAVKKESGGTRFTFTANDKTQFHGAGLASMKDLKKDDQVVVVYQVKGSQYIALQVKKR